MSKSRLAAQMPNNTTLEVIEPGPVNLFALFYHHDAA
jgi:hypothetical protein